MIAALAAPLAGCSDHTGNSPGGSGGSGIGSGGVVSGVTTGGVGGNAASSAGSASDSSIPATFETLKLVIQGGGPIMTCSAAPCHGVNGMAPPGRPLALPSNDDQLLYANLTSYVSIACGNLKLVVPGNPAASALPKILTAPCGKTPRMPYMCSDQDGNCVPGEYIAAITQWIAKGAPRP